MKKSNKKIPKTHLPKYRFGDRTPATRASSATDNIYGSPEAESPVMGSTQSMEGTQNIYNQGRAKSNMLGTNQKLTGNQYAQMGQAVAQGGMQAYQTSQTPGLSEYEKNQQYGNSIKSAETGVVSAINPIFGMIHAGVTAATAPLTAKATQTDEQGNLKNKNFAKADIIGQGFADPMAMIPTMISNKFSMKKYISSVEDDAKGKIAAQKAQEDAYNQQQAIYQQQQNDFINNSIQSAMAEYQNQPQGSYIQYSNGGMNIQPNAEIELTEGTNNAGSIREHDLPSHENATSKNQKYLPPATRILSTRLKNPLTGKPFSDETVNTKKAEKTLNDPNASPIAKKRANLDVLAANILFDRSYAVQEALKQAKVEAYAKKMGVTLPQAQEAPEEGMQFPMGGVKLPMYPYGGEGNMLSYGDDPRFYNYQGSKMMAPNLKALSKDSGVSPEIGLNNYNSLLNTRTQVRDSNINVNKQLPKFEYLNDPTKGSYDEQFNAYKKVYLPGFAMGGRKLPKYTNAGLTPDQEFLKTKFMGAEQNQRNLAFNKMTGNMNPRYNVSQSAWSPEELQASSDEMVSESYPEKASTTPLNQPETYPIRKDKNGKLLFDTPTSKSNIGSPKVTDPNDKNFDWGKLKTVGQNYGNFALQNAGNIYDLTRKKDPLQKYDRATAKFLDPSSAIRDALAQTRRAEYNVRGASGGNAGTYLSNRVALNAQNTENLARIHQNYQNANAQISNQNSQFNTEIAYREAEAQAKDRAMRQNVDSQAIHSMASNFGKMSKSSKQDNMEQKELDMFMYRYKNEPGFKEQVDKFRTA